jgi:hypothetical protein
MTFQVRLSQIGDPIAFDKAVKEHVARLVEFNRTVGKPRPTTHPLVEAAIKRIQRKNQADQYQPDYEIVNDIPADHVHSLEEKKQKLMAAITHAENEAKFRIIPQRKIRLFSLQFNAAMSTPEADRTPEQLKTIADYKEANVYWQKIELEAATAMWDLEEQTEDTIDNWHVPSLG